MHPSNGWKPSVCRLSSERSREWIDSKWRNDLSNRKFPAHLSLTRECTAPFGCPQRLSPDSRWASQQTPGIARQPDPQPDGPHSSPRRTLFHSRVCLLHFSILYNHRQDLQNQLITSWFAGSTVQVFRSPASFFYSYYFFTSLSFFLFLFRHICIFIPPPLCWC